MASKREKHCATCRVESAVAHLPRKICECNEECIGWYSLEHHLLFCKERIKAFKLFVPKIDLNLFSRFGDFFELDEKYSMILSSPSAADYVNLPKITIVPNFSNNNDCSGTIVVNKCLTINNCNNESIQKLFDSMLSKVVICVPRKVSIKNTYLSPENVLSLLSSYTKEFTFYQSRCAPNLNFTDIIKKAPNIEAFSNYDWETNIQIDKTWPEDLLKYKKGKNFRYLSFKFGVIEEFNIDKLREFIRTKCTKNVWFKIVFAQQLIRDDDDQKIWQKMEKIANNLYGYMDDNQKHFPDDDDPCIWIGFDGVDGYHHIYLTNCMNRRLNPTRAATKRRYNEKW